MPIVQGWAAVEPAKGQAAVEEARHAIRDLMRLGFTCHPISSIFSVDSAVLSRRGTRRLGAPCDRCRPDRQGAGSPADGRQDTPRASFSIDALGGRREFSVAQPS